MTREEFVAGVALRSGVTPQWIVEHSLEARPCNCEEEGCEGWQMVSCDAEDMANGRALRRLWEDGRAWSVEVCPSQRCFFVGLADDDQPQFSANTLPEAVRQALVANAALSAKPTPAPSV